MPIFPMHNAVRGYHWGSRSAIAHLQGRPDSAEPEAEVWMGSHPGAPSVIVREGEAVPLPTAIATAPESMVGQRALDLLPPGERAPGLPFLFKILAAEQGLSIQAHPSREQAARGFDREEAAGVALDAATRTYRDRNHKPELICALTEFWALRGFRGSADLGDEMGALAAAIGDEPLAGESDPGLGDTLIRLAELAKGAGDDLRLAAAVRRQLLAALLAAGSDERTRADLLGRAVALASARLDRERGSEPRDSRYWWVVELARQFPDDIGALAPLYLELAHLRPGEAAYLEAQVLHAYLYGLGVEIMATSDNVLRAGCTTKHVDAAGLQEILRFDIDPTPILDPGSDTVEHIPGGVRYPTGAVEFELARFEGPVHLRFATSGAPAIALAVGGEVAIADAAGTVTCGSGESAFVTADERSWGAHLEAGAVLFVASIPGALVSSVELGTR